MIAPLPELRPLTPTDPVGMRVSIVREDGQTIETRTRSEVWLLGDEPVVLVEGQLGHRPASACLVDTSVEPRAIRSFSAYARYLECPRAAQYTYLDRVRIPTASYFAVGRAVARAGEHALRAVKDGKPLPSLEEVLDVARTSARNEEGEIDWSQEPDDSRAAYADRVVAYARTYHLDVAPMLSPKEVEYRFEVEVDGIKLTGSIDVVDEDLHGRITHRDTKTAARKPPLVASMRYRLQLGIYALACDDTLDGVAGAIDYLVRSESEESGLVARHLPVLLSRDEVAAEAVIARDVVHHVHREVQAGNFPRNPLACETFNRLCPYAGRCVPERASAHERARAIALAEKARPGTAPARPLALPQAPPPPPPLPARAGGPAQSAAPAREPVRSYAPIGVAGVQPNGPANDARGPIATSHHAPAPAGGFRRTFNTEQRR